MGVCWMKKYFNFKKLKTKVLVGFAAVIGLNLLLSVFSIVSIQRMNQNIETLGNDSLPLLVSDEKMSFNVAERIALVRGYLLTGERDYKDKFNAYSEEALVLEKDLLQKTNSEKIKELLEENKVWQQMIVDDVFATYDAGKKEEASQLLQGAAQTSARNLMDGFSEIAQTREEQVMKESKEAIFVGQTVIKLSIGVTVFIMLLGLCIAIFTAEAITRPMKRVIAQLRKIADGDLSGKDLRTLFRDETAELVEISNELKNNNSNMIKKIQKSAELLTSHSEELHQSANETARGSDQIALTMTDLARSTESQVNSSGDMTQKMNGFTHHLDKVNHSGDQIQLHAEKALNSTKQGHLLMDESVNQMNKIDGIVKESVRKVNHLYDSSKEITQLVEVIQEISDQTNLLALNAAIEAARAGDQGKGFAVVADEVRKLAEQVSNSISDITTIVQRIQVDTGDVVTSLKDGYTAVEQGASQIQHTGSNFKTIHDSIIEVAHNVEQVSLSLHEVLSESEEMSQIVEESAALTQQSSAGIQETTASVEQSSLSMQEVTKSADDLAGTAEQLMQLVGKYKLN